MLTYALAALAWASDLLGVGYRPRRRRAPGEPFGAYPLGWRMTPHA